MKRKRITIPLSLLLGMLILVAVGPTDSASVSAASGLREDLIESLAAYIDSHEKPPIVLVHGWRGLDPDAPCNPDAPDPADYPPGYWIHLDDDLKALGFEVTYAKLITGFGFDGSTPGCSPVAEENVPYLMAAIDQALAASPGQDKVILLTHSMGGLVSRAYLESARYRHDVVELYTFGTPHLGTPINGLVLIIEALTLGSLNLHDFCVSQPVACQFSDDEALVQGEGFTGIATFNAGHNRRREGVHYHLVGGDADFGDRSFLGAIMDSIISPAADDGIVPRASATGINSFNNNLGPLAGPYERRETYELHVESFTDEASLFDSPQRKYTYFTQDEYQVDCPLGICGEPYLTEEIFSETYTTCLEPVIYARQPDHRCAGGVIFPAAAKSTSAGRKAIAPPVFETLAAGQSTSRSIWLEGGEATLFARSEEGSKLNVSLRAPDGAIIQARNAQTNPNILVKREENAAVFKLLDAQPGEWQLTLKAETAAPSGARTMTWGAYQSSVATTIQLDRPLYHPGEAGRLTVQLSGGYSNIRLRAQVGAGPAGQMVALDGQGGLYSGIFTAPNEPGYQGLSVRISGLTAAGLPFEQERRYIFPVTPETFSLSGRYTETVEPALQGPSQPPDFVVGVEVEAAAAGKVGLSADLLDSQGNFVSSSDAFGPAEVGRNLLALRFRGGDLLRSGHGGPYVLANVRLVDYSAGGFIVETAAEAYTSGVYDLSRFIPSAGKLPHQTAAASAKASPRIHDSSHICSVTPSNQTGSGLVVGDSFRFDFAINLDNGGQYPEWLDYYYVTGPAGWAMSGQSAAPANLGGWNEAMTQTFAEETGLAYWGFDYPDLADLDLANSILPNSGSFWGPWRPDTGAPHTFSLTYAVPAATTTCPGSAFIGIPPAGQRVTGVGVGDLVNASLNEVSCTFGGYLCPLPAVALTVTASAAGSCPGSATAMIPANDQTVTFCYTLTNTSDAVTVVEHTLVNSLIEDQILTVAIGPGMTHSFSVAATLAGGSLGNCYDNEVTWTAVSETGFGQQQDDPAKPFLMTTYQATDRATVTVCVVEDDLFFIYLPLIVSSPFFGLGGDDNGIPGPFLPAQPQETARQATEINHGLLD